MLSQWMQGEIDGDNGGAIAHTNEIRLYIVGVAITTVQDHFPEIKITRGVWDVDLGQSTGQIPDYVRRVFLEITQQNERLDNTIRLILKDFR